MPEDSKRQQLKKGKHEPKDQRKPRQVRHQPVVAEKKVEEPKVSVPEKPVFEEPGPEFYKNLKRETDEILKITEEANSKYKKKEIQSNWSKYEMPIQSYEEIEEQEYMGADYEKLIQTPLSIGGHFQFKHEKSWDISSDPSLYDKYFDINMDNLAIALSTIPFYDRNSIEKSVFTEIDILNMTNRSIRFKQKYFKDKSYSTPELDSQDKILNSLKEGLSKPSENTEKDDAICDVKSTLAQSLEKISINKKTKEIEYLEKEDYTTVVATPILDFKKDITLEEPQLDIVETSSKIETATRDLKRTPNIELVDETDQIILEGIENDVIPKEVELKKVEPVLKIKKAETIPESKEMETVPEIKKFASVPETKKVETIPEIKEIETISATKKIETVPEIKTISETEKIETVPEIKFKPEVAAKADSPEKQQKNNPVIESPEDLEKWLDDFLDG